MNTSVWICTKRLALVATAALTLNACGGGSSDAPGASAVSRVGSTAPLEQAKAAAAWQTAALIEQNNLGGAVDPKIVVDAQGNGLAVWSQFDGRYMSIFASRFTAAANNWGMPVLVEQNPGEAGKPDIAIEPGTGNAIVVWHQFDGRVHDILSSRYEAAYDKWHVPQWVELSHHNVSGLATGPKVGIDSVGRAIAVWSQDGGLTTQQVWASEDAGTGWKPPVLLQSTAASGWAAQIAMEPKGNATVVWVQGPRINRCCVSDIWAIRFDRGNNAWGADALVEHNSKGYAHSPQVVAHPKSNTALVVWAQFDGPSYFGFPASGVYSNIWGNRLDTSSNVWGNPVVIDAGLQKQVEFPQIAMSSSGTAHVVWRESNTSQMSNVRTNQYNAHIDTWSIAVLLDNNSGLADTPHISVNAYGDALAIWRQFDQIAGTTAASVNRFGSGANAWGTPEQIEPGSTSPSLSYFYPRIALDNKGNGLAAWVVYDGVRSNIWANRLQ